MIFEELYKEFGKEKVHMVRRELTIKNGEMPHHIELLAELYLQQRRDNNENDLHG